MLRRVLTRETRHSSERTDSTHAQTSANRTLDQRKNTYLIDARILPQAYRMRPARQAYMHLVDEINLQKHCEGAKEKYTERSASVIHPVPRDQRKQAWCRHVDNANGMAYVLCHMDLHVFGPKPITYRVTANMHWNWQKK